MLVNGSWSIVYFRDRNRIAILRMPTNSITSPHSLPKEKVLALLGTSIAGLSESDVKKRIEEYGLNRLTPKKKISALSIFLSQFKNALTIILLVAVVLVLFVYFFGEREQSDLIEAGLILAIVLMITFLGFIQEYKAEKALESLKKLLAFKAKVRRDNEEKEIDVTEIVPGDIIFLEEGLKVPADIRVLQSSSLYLNEASLTGESTTVEKSDEILNEKLQIADQTNMVFAGTAVTSGRGLGVVVKTGDATEIGAIAQLVAGERTDQTPIQKRLDAIGKAIGYIVLGICIVVFFFIAFFANEYSSQPLLQKVLHSFIAAVALAVAAIPEGLPAVVTISLAVGTQRMVKKNALVRKLNAVETLGSVDVICSDKTGTLTKNEMTVRELYAAKKLYTLTGTGYEKQGMLLLDNKKVDPSPLRSLFEAGYVCNNATDQKNSFLGDPTEIALLVSAKKAGFDEKFERVFEIPFSSERKMMSVVVKVGKNYMLYTKGAPEVILERTTEGKEERQQIQKIVDDMNSRALRTLAFACRPLSIKDFEKLKEKPGIFEKELEFLGVQGMIDPARVEVKPLIEQCKRSGIRTLMITGDHEATAKAIAREIGIEGESITGQALEAMSEKEFTKAVERISVYARINPASKMKIVTALKKNGHIVAMTGDGVNDAPALKKADVGIAMGITGTDVAKEASEIVLLDDKFSTIVAAIEEGRGIFQNIRKFVQYLLSCNIGEVILIFAGIILFKDLLLTATMLLWINVVTDGLPAVALGMDKAEKDIMNFSPKKFHTAIITRKMWVEMVIFGCMLTVALIGLYVFNINRESEIEAKGATFIAIAFFELVYLFIIRSSYNTPFLSNKWLFMAIILTIILQVMIVYVPFLARLFEVHRIDSIDWLYIFVVSILLWIPFKLFKKQIEI